MKARIFCLFTIVRGPIIIIVRGPIIHLGEVIASFIIFSTNKGREPNVRLISCRDIYQLDIILNPSVSQTKNDCKPDIISVVGNTTTLSTVLGMDMSPSDDIINEKDTRVTNKDAADDIEECYITETRDDSQDECCGAVLNRGGLISRGRSLVLLTERSLPKDTFSFIFISRLLSVPFLIAIIVFSFQIAIFSLVSVDVIDLSNSRNPFNIPTNVESTVRATQVLAIIIAIVTQDDVKKVILILRDGYDVDVFQGTFGPDATKFQWVLSLVLRASEGLTGLFVTFMLIMQSKTVLELLLNFSAMEFVSLLDDVAFSMLREEYFGIGMMEHATLCEKKYYVPHISSLKSSRFSAVYFIVIFAVMFSGWSGIYSEQATGMYLCQQMYVQLDDEFASALAGLSGIYTINNNEQFGGRVTSSQEKNGQGKIGYCEDENVWTLKIQDPLVPYDPCLDWVAKSSQSFDFDVLKTTSSQWRESSS